MGRDEYFERWGRLLCAGEAGAAQAFAPENTKPDFDLIEPACGGGREMKVGVRVLDSQSWHELLGYIELAHLGGGMARPSAVTCVKFALSCPV